MIETFFASLEATDESASELAAAKESLEGQVQARTSELADSVDQLRREAEARQRISDKLEIQNAELERFAYTVSHDLKSPLVTIEGFVELLRRDIADRQQERIESDIGRISDAAGTMKMLLDDLLELSRAGRMIGDLRVSGLTDIARQAAETMAGEISASGIELEIDEMPSVRVDATRLHEYALEGFLWHLAMVTARGRIPEGTPLDAPTYLRRWPNFTRLEECADAMRIAAVWVQQPRSLLNLFETLKVPVGNVLTFYTAAQAIGLAGIARREVDTLIQPAVVKPSPYGNLINAVFNRFMRHTS